MPPESRRQAGQCGAGEGGHMPAEGLDFKGQQETLEGFQRVNLVYIFEGSLWLLSREWIMEEQERSGRPAGS